MEHRRKGSVVGGLVLLIVGGLYLFANLTGEGFGAMAIYVGPLVAIVLGAYFLYRIYGPDRKPGRTPFPWPLFMIFGGLSALAAMTGFWSYTLSMGPVAMIIVGAWLLLRRT
jgi:hypothetical protein